MASKKSIFSRIRLVICGSSTRTKIMILIPLVIATAVLLCLRSQLADIKEDTEDLRQQAAYLEQENAQLQQNIAALGTIQSVQQIAGEELNLVDPNSTFFTPVPDNANPD